MRIAIIGTREVSKDQIDEIFQIIESKYGQDVIVHSGNALGVDEVALRFKRVNIFLPWSTYNEHLKVKGLFYSDKGNDDENDLSIQILFPHFSKLSIGAKKMIRRNFFIVMGDSKMNIPPVDTVVFYTGKGVKGGTAYGVNIAKSFEIPVEEVDLDRKELVRHD